MKTNVLSVLALGIMLSVSAYAQSSPTAAERKASRQVREQKIERSKGELKEMGQDAKEKAKVVGKAVSTEAKRAGETINRKAEERRAKRGTARRDTV